MNDDTTSTTVSRRSTTGLRRMMLTLVAALAVGAPFAIGVTAEAKSVPAGYKPNGCTLSPDRGVVPVYYDFKNQCNRHDYCYDELWYGAGENGRARCDQTFLSEMVGWCNSYYGAWYAAWHRGQCTNVAVVYYTAVRNLGRSYFDNPYKN